MRLLKVLAKGICSISLILSSFQIQAQIISTFEDAVGINTDTPIGQFHVATDPSLSSFSFSGVGLDDLSVDFSNYTGTDISYYFVQVSVDNTVPNLINLYENGSLIQSNVLMANSGITLTNGVTIGFDSLVGHTAGDAWLFDVTPAVSNILVVNSGTVGINTASPSKTLDVQGDVNFSGDLYKNGSLFTVNVSQGIDDLTDGLNDNDNLALGTNAGAQISTSTGNTLLGINAGANITSGSENTVVGENAALLLDMGSNNTLIGLNAGQNLDGEDNTFLGSSAGQNIDGNDNIIIGYNQAISAGDNNILIGNNSDSYITTNNNGNFIVANDNTTEPIIYVNENGQIGFNTNDVGGFELLRYKPTASTPFNLSEFTFEAPSQVSELRLLTSENEELAIGYFSSGGSLNPVNIVYDDRSSGTARVINFSDLGEIKQHANIAYKGSAGSWSSNSDARLKTNIETLDSEAMLAKVLQMRGVNFLWDDKVTESNRPAGTQIGFIAQDLQEIWPEKVIEDQQGYLVTAYGDYDPVFVEAIKALHKKIEAQENSNKALREKIEQLEQQLNAIINANISSE